MQDIEITESLVYIAINIYGMLVISSKVQLEPYLSMERAGEKARSIEFISFSTKYLGIEYQQIKTQTPLNMLCNCQLYTIQWRIYLTS
jgi:hypothetical protein